MRREEGQVIYYFPTEKFDAPFLKHLKNMVLN